MKGGWHEVTRLHPCPICKKPDWCAYHDDGIAVICPRTPDGCVRFLGDAGYLHRLGQQDPQFRALPFAYRKSKQKPAPEPEIAIDWDKLVAECEDRARGRAVKQLSEKLGVSVRSLRRLRMGLSAKGAWTFPMCDNTAKIIGIRLRGNDGRKWAVKGSKSGVFIPSDEPQTEPLMICEGPTDTAALLDLGYSALGRPSCLGGADHILLYCQARFTVIVADRDGPGLDGAKRLADRLWVPCGKKGVKTIAPVNRKDIRAWVLEGVQRSAIDSLIANAKFHSLDKKEKPDGYTHSDD